MKKILLTAAVLIFTAIFTVPAAFAQRELSGEWMLTQMTSAGKKLPIVVGGKVPTINFSVEGFSGNGSCNSYGGRYTVAAGKSFMAGPIRSTEMACVKPEINAREKAFFETLGKVSNYHVAGDTLSLSGEGTAYSLTFARRSADVEPPFLWIVDKQKVDCRGVVHQNCLQVKKRDFDQWEILREKIGGFAYKPGRYYLIRVKRVLKSWALANDPIFEYKLVKIISRTRLMPHVD